MAADQSSEKSFFLGELATHWRVPDLALRSLSVGEVVWLDNGPSGKPLWQIHAVDSQGRWARLDGSKAHDVSAEMREGTLLLNWRGIADEQLGAGPFDVIVEAHAYDDAGTLSSWKIRVDNHSEIWSLWHVAFPKLSGLLPLGAGDSARFFAPDGWGREYKAWSDMPLLERRYPNGWDMAMQFCGFVRGRETFYFGVHDGDLRIKDFCFGPEDLGSQAGTGQIVVTMYPEGMGVAGNGFEFDYETVFGVIPGDWYDAAQVYAEWARSQPWAISAGRSARDPGTEVHAWVGSWEGVGFTPELIEEFVDIVRRLREELGVRMGVHSYNWHEIPFDSNYPDYFPETKLFGKLVTRLRELDIVVMPYINGRLWDVNAPSWPKEDALIYAAKDSSRRANPITLFPYLEQYGADAGSGQRLAVMCPATSFWQDKVAGICDRIVNELGCDGIYIDQIGGCRAVLCFDGDHGHPKGGGTFWFEGYREMLAKIRRSVGEEAFLTTECSWEGCIGDFDALLMWHSTGDDLIPLYPSVYSGLATCFGCKVAPEDIEGAQGIFALRMGRLLVWGAQLGWGDLRPLLKKENRDVLGYFGKLCRLRLEHAAIFVGGRMLRPPEVRCVGAKDRCLLLVSLWQDERRGRAALFLVNPTREEIEAGVRITADECQGMTVQGDAFTHVTKIEGLSVELRLPALEALALPILPSVPDTDDAMNNGRR